MDLKDRKGSQVLDSSIVRLGAQTVMYSPSRGELYTILVRHCFVIAATESEPEVSSVRDQKVFIKFKFRSQEI
jgi:hypothetical protein